MAKPLKISENNAPLSCKQHDDNIDALLDRRNHTNEIKDCSTAINQTSLNQCVERLPAITTIATDLSDLRSEYDVLNASIIPNGDIDSSIQALGVRLNNELNPINATLLTIATDLNLVNFDSITNEPRFLLPSELEALRSDNTNSRELTRIKLDGVENRVDIFINQKEPVINKNTSDLSNLLNPTTGSFTILQQYVNGSLTTEVNKVAGIKTTLQGIGNRVFTAEALLGTSSGITEIEGKTVKKNIEDLYVEDETLNNKIQGVDTRIQTIENQIGNYSSIAPSTISQAIQINRDEIDELQQAAGFTGGQTSGLRNDFEELRNEVEKRHNFLYLEKKDPNTFIVNGGPYINTGGGRSYFTTQEITNTGFGNGGYFVYLTDGGTIETVIDVQPNGILLGTINYQNGVIDAVYNSYNAPVQGYSLPYKSPRFGGRGTADYTPTGTGNILTGTHYFKSVHIQGGVKVIIEGGAKIFVERNFRCDGAIEVLPVVQGGRPLQQEVSRGFLGNEPGGGISWHRSGYHWSTFPFGTGGRNGIAGTLDTYYVAVLPRGGSGGGGLIVQAGKEIIIDGVITAEGEDGKKGNVQFTPKEQGGVSGSGGGAGGCVVLQSAFKITVNASAQIRCNGGSGGETADTGGYKNINGAGGGGGGWISLTAPIINRNANAQLESKGGIAGTNSLNNLSVIDPGQGGAFGGAFGGKGGNGSSSVLSERNGEDNPIEIILEHPAI